MIDLHLNGFLSYDTKVFLFLLYTANKGGTHTIMTQIFKIVPLAVL
jgi:hypothetical protein